MSTLLLGIRYFFLDLIGGVLRWPLWWYTQGFKLVATWCVDTLRGYTRTLAVGVWIKNIFVPMFGMYDWQSRIISFLMRVAQIIGRLIVLCFLFVIVVLAFILYLAILPVAVGFTAYHFMGALVA